MEQRHDWAAFQMTPELFKYVVFNLVPEVIVHSQHQDQEQVRDHYDRGDDFYGWYDNFLFGHQFAHNFSTGSLGRE